jgi:hypothetical protein
MNDCGSSARFVFGLVFLFLWGAQAGATEAHFEPEPLESRTVVYTPEAPPRTESPTELRFSLGGSTFDHLEIANPYYTFSYPEHTRAISFSVGWEYPFSEWMGEWSWAMDLSYHYLRSEHFIPGVGLSHLHLNLIPVSLNIQYSARLSPALRHLTPHFELGAGYMPYFQAGETEGAFAAGGAWTRHFAVGLRHDLSWLGWKSAGLSLDLRWTAGHNATGIQFKGRDL